MARSRRFTRARVSPRQRSLSKREQQLVAVGIVDLEAIVSPPHFRVRHGVRSEIAAKISKSCRCELDEQPRLVPTVGCW